MRYELKGRLLDLTHAYAQQYKDWHSEVLGRLQEIEPQTTGYVLSYSVWTGSRVSGIITSPEVLLEKWRAGKKPGWWEPNRRFTVGKKASKIINELPKEPDLAGEIMAALGFKQRYFSLPGLKYSAPGSTWMPRTGKAFIEWAPEYPPVNDPDMVEVLESYYHRAVEEHKALENRRQ